MLVGFADVVTFLSFNQLINTNADGEKWFCFNGCIHFCSAHCILHIARCFCKPLDYPITLASSWRPQRDVRNECTQFQKIKSVQTVLVQIMHFNFYFCDTSLFAFTFRNWQYKTFIEKIMNNQHHACIVEANYYVVSTMWSSELALSTE